MTSPARATPQKDNAVELIIEKLNKKYDMGLYIPDGRLSPLQIKALGQHNKEYRLCDCITGSIRFLYYKRDGTMERALASFSTEAAAENLGPVAEPQSDTITFAVPPKHLAAKTPTQRLRLQELLNKVLDRFRVDAALSGRTPFKRRESEPSAQSGSMITPMAGARTTNHSRLPSENVKGQDSSPLKRVEEQCVPSSSGLRGSGLTENLIDSVPTKCRLFQRQEAFPKEGSLSLVDRSRYTPSLTASYTEESTGMAFWSHGGDGFDSQQGVV